MASGLELAGRDAKPHGCQWTWARGQLRKGLQRHARICRIIKIVYISQIPRFQPAAAGLPVSLAFPFNLKLRTRTPPWPFREDEDIHEARSR